MFLSLCICVFKIIVYEKRRRRSTQSLTEVTVISLFVDEAHGDVPASSSADARVARPLAFQGPPGHPQTLLYHSNSIVRRGSSLQEWKYRRRWIRKLADILEDIYCYKRWVALYFSANNFPNNFHELSWKELCNFVLEKMFNRYTSYELLPVNCWHNVESLLVSAQRVSWTWQNVMILGKIGWIRLM